MYIFLASSIMSLDIFVFILLVSHLIIRLVCVFGWKLDGSFRGA